MANDLSNPVNATVSAKQSGEGFFDHGSGSDSLFGGVQLAQAEGGATPGGSTPPAPGQTIHVNPPQDAAGPVVIRVEVALGSIVELPQPFDADAALAAKEGDGNLAIRVGDVTVILQGYIQADNDPQHPVTIEGADGKPIDIATILASTDPAIDIQTAAGPGDTQGGQGADNTGAILAQLDGGNGLGGFEGAGAQDQTQLGYSLIDGSLRQEFAQTLTTPGVFGFSVGQSLGLGHESSLRDPAQVDSLGSFDTFMHEYQDAVEHPGAAMFAGWADFQGTGVTGESFQDYLDQTSKTTTVTANFTGATGDLVLTDIVHNVTSNRSDLTVEVTDGGHTMFIRRDEATALDTGHALVAVVHVEGPDASGQFTIQTILINRLDHGPGDNGKDEMSLEVQFKVYDGPAPNPETQEGEGTGDQAPQSPSIEGSFSTSFTDDVPILESVQYHNQHEIIAHREAEGGSGSNVGLVDEDWLHGGSKDKDIGTTGDTGGGTCVTGCIKVDFGADGAANSDGVHETAGKHAFVLDTTAYHLGQDFPYGATGLSSGGQPLKVLSVGRDHLTVGIEDTKQQITALVEGDETPSEPTDPIPGRTIFTLTLNQDTGQFEFDLKGPLDHGTPSDAIFGDETGLNALTVEAPATGTEETISLAFGVTATDDDGDKVQAEIDIDVNDDVPVARDDHDHVEKGSFATIYGDVMTAYGEDSNAGKDSVGGDGAIVLGVAAGQLTGDQTTGAGEVIQGTYGKLSLGWDGGKYTYTRDPGTPGGGDDHFTYTLKDGDGDTSTAVLTVHIDNACVTITLPDCPADTTVHESGLPERNGEPEGTDAAANSETTSGHITINAPDTIATLQIGSTTLTLAELNALTPGTPVTIQDGTRGELVLNHFDAGSGHLDYTYNLLDNDLVSGDSTTASFDIAVKDLDGSEGDATLTIKIVDDEPTANCDSISVNATMQPTADVQFIFDVSGSMEDLHVSVPGSSYPDNGIGLERYAAAQMLAAHPEIQNVQVVLFSDHASHSAWMTATAALAYLQNSGNFNGGGATNYDLALTEAMSAYDASARPLPQGDQTLLYFFSDGGPNQPNNGAGIDNNTNGSNVSVTDWENFVKDAANDISNVFAVGVGSISPSELGQLVPISYPNTDTQAPIGQEDNYLSIGSSNVAGLIQTLDHVIVPVVTPVTGDVTLNDVPGADDFGTGKLVSVAYEATTLAFDATTHQHTIDLGAGRGTLVINDDGTYTYTPPAGQADGTPFFVEYTIQDGDGDQSTAKLKIDINTRPETDLNGAATGANGSASFIEQTPVLVAPAGTVSDDDGVTKMTVTLTNRPDGNAVESLSLDSAADAARAGAGLTFSYNAATGVATITGPLAPASVYQAILQGILYNNTSDTPNTATRNVTVVVNDGTSDSVIHNVAVSVTPVNDAPTASIIPLSFTVDEQTNLNLSGKIGAQFNMLIGDVDAGNDTVTVTLSVTEGKLHVDEGNSGADVWSGNDTSIVVIKGSVAEINNLLKEIDTGGGSAGSVKYYDDTDTPAVSVQLTLSVNDNGENGTGGAKSASDTATIIVNNTNDKPVTDLNGGGSGSDNSASFIEQTAVKIAPSGTVIDDSGKISSMTVTLTNRPDGNGVESLSLNSAAQTAATNAGLTVSLYNAATGVITISGPLASASVYQTILQGIEYNNSSDTPNTTHRTVTVVVSDGSLSSTSHSIDISVTPVNDAPTADLTTNFTVNEQTDINLSGKLGAQFNMLVNDVDSGGDNIFVTLSVTEGKITVDAGNSGVDIWSGNGTGSVTVRGSLAEINNLLHEIDTGGGSAGTVKYKDDTDTPSSSPITLSLTVNDDGQNGTGGALTATDTATITVNNTNDKPVTDLNGGSSGSDNSASFIEQTAVKIAPSGTVIDDSGKISSMTVTLTNRPDGNSVESLSLNSAADTARIGAGLSVTYTASSGVLSITGPLAAASVYQTILQGIQYNNSSDTPDTTHRTVTVVVSDGSLSSDSHSIDISVTPVNDAPTAMIDPVSFTVNEQTDLSLSGKIGAQFNMLIGDVDSGNDTMTVTLSVGKGTLTIDEGNSGADVWSGNGSSSVVIKGSVTQINNLFKEIDTGFGSAGSVKYSYDSDTPDPSTTLTLQVNDNANNGTGGAMTASDTAIIYITDTPEAPIACDDNVITNAGSNTFSIPDWALTYNDSDADTPNSGLSLPAGDSAVLNASGGTAHHPGDVTFADSNGSSSSSFDYKVTDGTQTDIGHVKVTQDSGDINGSSGDDIVVVYGPTAATVNAGDGSDIVLGGSGKDTLNGENGNDLIYGGAGNDTIDGGSGNDLIFGQAGDDTMIFRSGDKYDGGDNFDRIQISGGGTSVTYDAAKFLNVEMIDLGDGNDRSGSANQNSLSLNAADLGVHNFGSINGHQISLFVIGDQNGSNANNRDNVDLTGFNASPVSNGNFTDASGQSHNFDVYQSVANSAIKVAVEHSLDVV